MKRLLQLKHWQIFLLMWVPGFIAHLFSSDLALLLFPVLILFFGGIHVAWWYAIGTEMHRRLPEELRSSALSFRIHTVYLLFVIAMIGAMMMFKEMWMHNNIASTVFIILILYYFPAFVIVVRFAAKSLASFEKQGPARAEDYMGYFLLLWLSFIGVWTLHPKLNRIVDAT